MTTFILAFAISTFCAWYLTDAGFYLEAVVLAGVLGILSGAFVGHLSGGDDES